MTTFIILNPWASIIITIVIAFSLGALIGAIGQSRKLSDCEKRYIHHMDEHEDITSCDFGTDPSFSEQYGEFEEKGFDGEYWKYRNTGDRR